MNKKEGRDVKVKKKEKEKLHVRGKGRKQLLSMKQS